MLREYFSSLVERQDDIGSVATPASAVGRALVEMEVW